jgi:hypothetical protein
LERFHAAFEQSPRRSARRHARTLELTRRSLCRFLEDLKFHPYKLHVVQKFRNTDKQNRRTTCVKILAMMKLEPLFLQHLLISDEAKFFFLDMCVKRISGIGPVKILEIHMKSLRRVKNLWYGVQLACVGLLVPTFLQ